MSSKEVTVGNFIQLEQGMAIVAYADYVDGQLMIGVVLLNRNSTYLSDGYIGGSAVYPCPKKRGVWINPEKIIKILSPQECLPFVTYLMDRGDNYEDLLRIKYKHWDNIKKQKQQKLAQTLPSNSRSAHESDAKEHGIEGRPSIPNIQIPSIPQSSEQPQQQQQQQQQQQEVSQPQAQARVSGSPQPQQAQAPQQQQQQAMHRGECTPRDLVHTPVRRFDNRLPSPMAASPTPVQNRNRSSSQPPKEGRNHHRPIVKIPQIGLEQLGAYMNGSPDRNLMSEDGYSSPEVDISGGGMTPSRNVEFLRSKIMKRSNSGSGRSNSRQRISQSKSPRRRRNRHRHSQPIHQPTTPQPASRSSIPSRGSQSPQPQQQHNTLMRPMRLRSQSPSSRTRLSTLVVPTEEFIYVTQENKTRFRQTHNKTHTYSNKFSSRRESLDVAISNSRRPSRSHELDRQTRGSAPASPVAEDDQLSDINENDNDNATWDLGHYERAENQHMNLPHAYLVPGDSYTDSSKASSRQTSATFDSPPLSARNSSNVGVSRIKPLSTRSRHSGHSVSSNPAGSNGSKHGRRSNSMTPRGRHTRYENLRSPRNPTISPRSHHPQGHYQK